MATLDSPEDEQSEEDRRYFDENTKLHRSPPSETHGARQHADSRPLQRLYPPLRRKCRGKAMSGTSRSATSAIAEDAPGLTTRKFDTNVGHRDLRPDTTQACADELTLEELAEVLGRAEAFRGATNAA